MNLILYLSLLGTLISCTWKDKAPENAWHSLFNGKNLDGWIVKIHHHEVGDNYANTFRVTDGVIKVNYDDYDSFDNRYGHLFYEEPFSSYHLKFKYRFTDQWRKGTRIHTPTNRWRCR